MCGSRGRREIGIEVKSAATVGAKDFKGLKLFQKLTSKSFCAGGLLYTGTQSPLFIPDVPISVLWT